MTRQATQCYVIDENKQIRQVEPCDWKAFECRKAMKTRPELRTQYARWLDHIGQKANSFLPEMGRKNRIILVRLLSAHFTYSSESEAY